MKNFTVIHNELLEESQLSNSARLLQIILIKYCGQNDWCYPTQQTLAKNLKCSSRYIRIILNELIKNELVIKIRKGFNKPNTYKVAKEFTSGGNYSSPHIGSKFPLNSGTTVPPKSIYRKPKVKKGMELLNKKVHELGLRKTPSP